MIRNQIKISIIIVSLLFVFSFAVGYIKANLYPNEAILSIGKFNNQTNFIKDLSPLSIFLYIFINNSVKAFFVIMFGVFFGLVALIFVYVNGELVGLVVGVLQAKLKLSAIVAGLLPHGIFEIPAILIASGYGLWLGYRSLRWIFFKDNFKEYFRLALRQYFIIVLPLLFIAAIIETFITPYILQLFK